MLSEAERTKIANKIIAMTPEEREIGMFGVTRAELKEFVESSLTFEVSGPAMVAASMMSDAQEEIAHGMIEEARQTLNRAKWVLFKYAPEHIRK